MGSSAPFCGKLSRFDKYLGQTWDSNRKSSFTISGRRVVVPSRVKLTRCPCGEILTAREKREHRCPLKAGLWGGKREGSGRPPTPEPELEMKPEQYPVSAVTLERQALVASISAYRKRQGIEDSSRTLRNRSLAQLRKMNQQILAGNTYRQGRRWKVA